MKQRKICVITGSRAEYGLLYWIIKCIHNDPDLELQLVVTGMHLSPEFGLTVKQIEKDGFPIVERVEMLLSSDTETAIVTSMGIGMIGFAKTYERLRPDILLVLGDRFEVLSAVAAAAPFNLLVAHIHGGESTEGAIDELFRHAITKMSHFHFPATQEYANRIIQMGEPPESVFCFGAPGLDSVYKLDLLDKTQLAQELALPYEREWGVITYHPVTLEKNISEIEIDAILNALEKFSEMYWVFTLPNADTESRIIIEKINKYVLKRPANAKLYSSLGQLSYFSLLKSATVMVGNSSSGLIEAPSFELPVVNVGERQKGRIRAKNVIDILEYQKSAVAMAINKALSKDFRYSLKGIKNPYGIGNTSINIVVTIKAISSSDRLKKKFYKLKAAEVE